MFYTQAFPTEGVFSDLAWGHTGPQNEWSGLEVKVCSPRHLESEDGLSDFKDSVLCTLQYACLIAGWRGLYQVF